MWPSLAWLRREMTLLCLINRSRTLFSLPERRAGSEYLVPELNIYAMLCSLVFLKAFLTECQASCEREKVNIVHGPSCALGACLCVWLGASGANYSECSTCALSCGRINTVYGKLLIALKVVLLGEYESTEARRAETVHVTRELLVCKPRPARHSSSVCI